MKDSKTHYRKVFKSDHLGVADLEDYLEEGRKLVFTIKHARQEINVAVAGRKGDFNIAYFNENIKPLVLNATNSKVVKKFAKGSPFVEDWNNILVELYIDRTVKMKGDVVGGVRIRTVQPRLEKPPFPVSDKRILDRAILIYSETKSFAKMETRYTLSNDVKQKIKEGVTQVS